jgi:phosphoglycerol transferase MdoB-like AlkP superfamily enzyme
MKLKMGKTTCDVYFMLCVTLISLLMFSALRCLLLVRNNELLEGIPGSDIVISFLIGVRFDLIVVSYILLPLVFALLLPKGLGKRRIALLWLTSLFAITIFLGVAELDFYYEFHNRLNSIAYHYLQEDAATVSSMIWNGFPVVRYLLLWLVLVVIYIYALKLMSRLTTPDVVKPSPLLVRISTTVLILALLVIGARGATIRSGPPLRWGDAFHSTHLFANHLALNGTYTIIKAIKNASREAEADKWLRSLPAKEALETTRKMLLTETEVLLKPETRKVLRRSQPKMSPVNDRIKNVVVVLMESFSGKFVGALGNDYNITPEFDKLAGEGLLFENFFSNGTHTHQGVFATFASFPNLPGFEYLMQQPQGGNSFSGLPALLKREKFNDLYVYNGDFTWDNQEGFFRNQGLTNFVGRHDYVNPKFQDRTWGVSDEDMFSRAVVELDKIDSEQPFFAMVQTLSNHTPYALPEKLPVAPVTDMGGYSEHLTAMRYSDWALGEFFKAIKHKPFYNETLFVILGDHGFGVKPQISDIDLLRYHVPLLLIAPGLTQEYGQRITTVATQVDVIPTILGLLGKPFTHQSWGRDILSLGPSDKGFGIIKPSGSDQTVAMLRGDTILVKQPGVDARLGRYALRPEPTYQPVDDAELKNAMTKELLSYIETALYALHENQSGLE